MSKPQLTPLKIIGSFFALLFFLSILITITSYILSPPGSEFTPEERRQYFAEADKFIYAEVAQHWIIKNGDIFLFPSPIFDTKKILGIIPLNATVEILDSKGNTQRRLEHGKVWKKVAVLDTNFQTSATGWINAMMVTKSKTLSESIPN